MPSNFSCLISGPQKLFFRLRTPLSQLLLGLCALMWAPGCARVPPVPPAPLAIEAGQFLLPDAERITLAQAAAKAQGASIILMGESHNHPGHHQAQADFLAALAEAGLHPVLALEMIPARHQKFLRAFNQRQAGPASLEQSLQWKKNWGYDFSLYLPVFSTASRYGVPVYGLNVSREAVRAVQQKGAAKARQQYPEIPARLLPPVPEQRAYLEQVFSRHAGLRSADSSGLKPDFERFMEVQSLWDTVMAQNALALHDRLHRPILVLAGSGHVEYGFGIASRLRALRPNIRLLLVSPVHGADFLSPGQNAPAPGKGQTPAPGGSNNQQDQTMRDNGFLHTAQVINPARSPQFSAKGDILYYYPPAHAGRLGLALLTVDNRVWVEAVDPGSVAAQAGFMRGDSILSMDGQPVHAPADMHAIAMGSFLTEKSVPVIVKRRGDEVLLRLSLGDKAVHVGNSP